MSGEWISRSPSRPSPLYSSRFRNQFATCLLYVTGEGVGVAFGAITQASLGGRQPGWPDAARAAVARRVDPRSAPRVSKLCVTRSGQRSSGSAASLSKRWDDR